MVALAVFQATAFFIIGLMQIPLFVAAAAMVPAAGLSVYGAWLGRLRQVAADASPTVILLRAVGSGIGGGLVCAGSYALGLASV